MTRHLARNGSALWSTRATRLAGIGLLAGLTIVLMITNAAAQNVVTTGNKDLTVAHPTGYCMLDPDDAGTRATLDRMARWETGPSRVHFAFADCQQLMNWYQGRAGFPDDYGFLATPSSMDSLVIVGVTQATVNQALRDEMGMSGKTATELSDEQFEDILERAFDGLSVGQVKRYGPVVDDSPTGLVQGLVSAGGPTRTRRSAGLRRILVVSDRGVIMWLFTAYDNVQSVRSLLAVQENWAREILAANP